MAVFKHRETGKRFLFVHIPRTAGRFVERNLEAQGWDWDNNLNLTTMYHSFNGIEVAHFHREYYQEYLESNNIPHISIIRNPIDRFISASFFLTYMYGSDIQESMEDPFYFYNMLENYPITESKSWYRNQLDFLSKKTHTWKFEDGFEKSFDEWLSNIVGVDIKMNALIKYTTRNEGQKLKKTDALISNIKKLYRNDIEKLYPELG